MELFAGFEADGFAWSDADFGASSGVAADSGLARSNAEDAESAQFDTVTGGQGLLEPFEYRVHGSFRLGPRQACPLDDVMHNILLDQCLGPFIEEIWENLAPAKSCRPEWPTGEMLLGVGGVVNLRVLQYHKQLRDGASQGKTPDERKF
jgi:hypothetical protein